MMSRIGVSQAGRDDSLPEVAIGRNAAEFVLVHHQDRRYALVHHLAGRILDARGRADRDRRARDQLRHGSSLRTVQLRGRRP
jgi:hypothetical protein